MIKKPNNKGFAAVIAVMLIGGAAIIFSSFILFDSIDQSRLSLQSIQFEAAKYSATTCFEDTMIRIKREETFTTDQSYQIDADHSCTTDITFGSVTGSNPSYYPVDLTVVGTSFDTTRTFEYDLRVDNYDVYYNTGVQERLHNIDIVSIDEPN